MKEISKELSEFLTSAPKIVRTVKARYDPISVKSIATITYTTDDGKSFEQEFDICYGPILDITDIWIGDIYIPPEDISFERGSKTKSAVELTEP